MNYRRHDTEGESGRLFDDLVFQFGERSVFMDVAAIEAGRDFRKAIDESVAGCGVLLAMIGPGWIDAANESGELRLNDSNDFVRMEIASALKRDIPVIPVLVRGAKMPRAHQLPDDLRDLAYRNCVELTHARWKSDVQVLIGALRPLVGEPSDVRPSNSGAPTDSSDRMSRGVDTPSPTVIAPSATISQTGPAIEAPPAGGIGPEALDGVMRELARYIGPIAEIVVKRAAKRCGTVAELRRTVAEEIDSSAERTRFLEAGGAS